MFDAIMSSERIPTLCQEKRILWPRAIELWFTYLCECADRLHPERLLLWGSLSGSEIRSYFAQGLSTSADIVADRFEKEMRAKRLSARVPGRVRGRALIDLMQGMLLRAKAGVSREALLQDALSYVPLILD